jgi:hypothetical protein
LISKQASFGVWLKITERFHSDYRVEPDGFVEVGSVNGPGVFTFDILCFAWL